jgi:hypothetical protein
MLILLFLLFLLHGVSQAQTVTREVPLPPGDDAALADLATKRAKTPEALASEIVTRHLASEAAQTLRKRADVVQDVFLRATPAQRDAAERALGIVP